ncbi:hypothetical protein XELAEV_18016796mg [Xenopus laevis]|uniref:Uncharacterized protein n=1 Tax=Xenopus laevis TaxID=8355 RepID=A0A974DC36_XENLA|nr:hypothetical protein XELAEV_18016796mg [Xenopus laevis]
MSRSDIGVRSNEDLHLMLYSFGNETRSSWGGTGGEGMFFVLPLLNLLLDVVVLVLLGFTYLLSGSLILYYWIYFPLGLYFPVSMPSPSLRLSHFFRPWRR